MAPGEAQRRQISVPITHLIVILGRQQPLRSRAATQPIVVAHLLVLARRRAGAGHGHQGEASRRIHLGIVLQDLIGHLAQLAFDDCRVSRRAGQVPLLVSNQ